MNPRPHQKEKHAKPKKNKNTKTLIRELNPRPPETTRRPQRVWPVCCSGAPQDDSDAARKNIKNTANTKHHEAHWAGFEPKTHHRNKKRNTQKPTKQNKNSDPGVEPKTTRDDRSAFGRFAVRVHPRTTAKPPEKNIKNTANTKHHEAHWAGFEPKTQDQNKKRNTQKPNKNKNTKTATRELNPRPPETTAALEFRANMRCPGTSGLRGLVGFSRVSVGFSGFQWVSVGFSGFQWVSVGCGGLWWVVVGCGGLWWVFARRSSLMRASTIDPGLGHGTWRLLRTHGKQRTNRQAVSPPCRATATSSARQALLGGNSDWPCAYLLTRRPIALDGRVADTRTVLLYIKE